MTGSFDCYMIREEVHFSSKAFNFDRLIVEMRQVYILMKLIKLSSFNLLIPLSIVAHFIYPIQYIVYAPLRYVGVGVILLGLIINSRAANQLRKMQTSVEFDKAASRLVTDGIFRFSRNPMYLGGILVLFGIAIFLGSGITFFFPVLLFLILDNIYIPIEESQLEEIFGTAYLGYQQATRRWI